MSKSEGQFGIGTPDEFSRCLLEGKLTSINGE